MKLKIAALAGAAALVVGVAGCGASTSSGGDPTSPSTAASEIPPPPTPDLPRGGREIFPNNFVVMYYGHPLDTHLGVLGQTSADKAAEKLEKAAAPWAVASGKPVLPAFEVITTTAQGDKGPDGDYSAPLDKKVLQKYLDIARANKLLLVMDLQPGRATFLEQAKLYEDFLKQPDVGIALDPEWRLHGNQKPLGQIGSSTAAEINETAAYVSQIVQENNLPQKLFIVHQFKSSQFTDRNKIVAQPGLGMVLHIDGFGTPSEKISTYTTLVTTKPPFYYGFKLFYKEDRGGLMGPTQVLKLNPPPVLVSYQ